jgi:hypothetical protein
MAALGPQRDATIEEIRHDLAGRGLSFGFGTIQRFFVRQYAYGHGRWIGPRARGWMVL